MPSSQQQMPVITFLSDYGLADDFVGICHGVIASACPQARVIDLTHGIARHDVRSAAIVLAEAIPYLPVGVHLAVVDPDVGAQRRAVALRTGDRRRFVGPDNGLLTLAAEAAGGIVEVVEIARSPFRLKPVSATFHGRDIFAPVAAALAGGATLADAGEPVDAEELITLALPVPRIRDGAVVAHVRYVDRFGNLQLNVRHEDLAQSGLRLGHPATIEPGDGSAHPVHYVRTFADAVPDELLLYEDAQRRLAIAVNHGDASQRLGLVLDAELRIRPG
ncbi:MAG: S-adenosyl-l-methionine hydroxide adenosyltransferase family protein [Solirubrobacteraceae bacterium]